MVYVGSPGLRKKAKPVKKIDQVLERIFEDMLDTMYEQNGVGLAGPQIGINQRIIVIDAGEGPIALANPKIVAQVGRKVGLEGCLSIPGIFGYVERHEHVVVEGLVPGNEIVQIEASGLLSVVFQHEIDHLDGRLFSDLATDFYDLNWEEES